MTDMQSHPQPLLATRPRKQIKDFKQALKDFENMVRDGFPLINGREITNFSLRPREAWANWLLCVVWQKAYGRDMTFIETSEEEGDGILLDKATGEWIMTEHVCALNNPGKHQLPLGEKRVMDAIDHKIARGSSYAKKKMLVVFFDGEKPVYRNKIREHIRGRHQFEMVYIIGLMRCGDYGYEYSVTELREKDSTTHKVTINEDFTSWRISELKDTHRIEIATGKILASWIQETPLP